MSDIEISIDEKITTRLKKPSNYVVKLLNDDKTPMEWVVDLLQTIYKHSHETAEKITLDIHNNGSAVVGVYTFEIAEVKAQETVARSRHNGFPLNAMVEAE